MRRAAAEVTFEVDRARSGAPSLAIGGRRVHGSYDPECEARRQAERIAREAGPAATIVLIGAGLGWLVQALRAHTRSDVVVWEPFGALHAELRRAIRNLPGAPRCAPPDASSPAAFERALAGRLAHVAVHPGYEDLTRFEQRFALRVLQRAQPASHRAAVACERSFDALRRMSRLRCFDSIEGVLAGRSVVVASGGPSLDAALPALRAAGPPLLAAPQALERLLRADVRVDFVVNPDPQDLLTPLLGPGAAPFGALLADTASHPAVLDRCPSRCFLFHLRSPTLEGAVWSEAGLSTIDEPFVTVSETAFHLARRLGASRVLLAGCDFTSTTRSYGAPLAVRSASGATCASNPVYFHAARALADAIAHGAGAVDVRRLGEGVEVDGARTIAVDELDAWFSHAVGVSGLAGAPGLPARDEAAERLRAHLRRRLAGPCPRTRCEPFAPATEPWRGFAPLAASEAARCWRELRAEFTPAGGAYAKQARPSG